MPTLYIYDADTMTVIAEINAETNAACEEYAAENYSDEYLNTYTPAFGSGNGLNRNGSEEVINVEG